VTPAAIAYHLNSDMKMSSSVGPCLSLISWLNASCFLLVLVKESLKACSNSVQWISSVSAVPPVMHALRLIICSSFHGSIIAVVTHVAGLLMASFFQLANQKMPNATRNAWLLSLSPLNGWAGVPFNPPLLDVAATVMVCPPWLTDACAG